MKFLHHHEVSVSQTTITEVAHHLNTKLHGKAKKSITDFKNTDMYTNLNISLLISDTDPILLKFIRQLTSKA